MTSSVPGAGSRGAARSRSVLIALVLVSAIAGCGDSLFGGHPFDRALWIASPASHPSMVDDLIAEHLRPGMTKAEVCDLLGLDPSAIGNSWSEELGGSPGCPLCAYFELEFDDAGLLVKAYMNLP